MHFFGFFDKNRRMSFAVKHIEQVIHRDLVGINGRLIGYFFNILGNDFRQDFCIYQVIQYISYQPARDIQLFRQLYGINSRFAAEKTF